MKYVILGASAAGLNAAKTIRESDPNGEIKLFSEDTKIYSRSMLNLYISGKRDLESLCFVDNDFFKKYNIHWVKGVSAISLDSYFKEIKFSNNTTERYDKLLIATGSSPIIPDNIKNIENSNNIFTLRTIEDAISIKKRIETAKSAIVIGGGLIGIDIVSQLMNTDLKLDVIEYGNNILGLQLDPYSAKPYEDVIRKSGVGLHTNVVPTDIYLDENNNFEGIQLNNGKSIMADMLIVSAGSVPNIDFLEGSEILINSGVVEVQGRLLREGVLVNKYCETNRKTVFAAGDVCAEKLGIWPLAVKQGIVAGKNMVGKDKQINDLFGLRNSMNFFGIRSISLGDPNLEGEDYKNEIYKDGKIYKRIIHKDGIIKAVILQNELQQAGVFEMLIKNQVDISKIEKNIFDIGYSDFFNIEEDGQFKYELD